MVRGLLALSVTLLTWACASNTEFGTTDPTPVKGDPHSFSRPEQVAVRHLDLELDVDFGTQIIKGKARYRLIRHLQTPEVILDTRDLKVHRVLRGTSDDIEDAPFDLGAGDELLGRPLHIELASNTQWVEVLYEAGPRADALQWLTPEQTSGKRSPFLFTQSQAILARTWVPCQDTPAVKMTYRAMVDVPEGLLALMSALNPQEKSPDGSYEFLMEQPIPSYLLALAVGDLQFRRLGERSGVYAEPALLEAASWEFADTEEMIRSAEKLYGPYLWDRYDMLVLPPSFPYGGMENPRLTFLTPTIIAGDRSLTSLIAHELAHSWSGNLVTNATWNDFWLNEGFTTYIEHRIVEEVYGAEAEKLQAALSRQLMEQEIEKIGGESVETRLVMDLAGRDPDSVGSSIAYDKGQFFLRALERAVGRERWDKFLRNYFANFKFESLTSEQFAVYLKDNLFLKDEVGSVSVRDWLYGTGLPNDCPQVESSELSGIRAEVLRFEQGTAAADLQVQEWQTPHWLLFLREIPRPLTVLRVSDLDRTFDLGRSRNSEILHEFLLISVESGYQEVYPTLRKFLVEQGRRKFLTPLYSALSRTPDGLELAKQIFSAAGPTYHPVSRIAVEEILRP